MKGVVFPTAMRKTVKSKQEELQLIDKTTTTKVKEKTKTFIGNIWTCNQKMNFSFDRLPEFIKMFNR